MDSQKNVRGIVWASEDFPGRDSMEYQLVEDKYGRCMLIGNERYVLFGQVYDGKLYIENVEPRGCEALDEVHIPVAVDGMPVAGVHLPNGIYEKECPDYVERLYVPDCIQNIKSWGLRYVKQTQIIPTDHPLYRVKGQMLLSMDGRRLVAILSDKVEKAVVPEGVEVIGSSAFDCREVHELLLPRSLRKIEDGGFYGVKSGRLVVPDGVEFLGEQAFANASLEAVILPDGLKSMEKWAFCRSRIGLVHLPADLRELPGDTFQECCFGQVELPQGLEVIGGFAFEESNLRSLRLPEGLREIGEYAFNACRALEHVDFPASLQKIGTGAFMHCPRLEASELPGEIEMSESVFYRSSEDEDIADGFVSGDEEGRVYPV